MGENTTAGRPDDDRRENVLDPASGTSGHRAASIRDEQGTHEAGAVPAAFMGDGVTSEGAAKSDRPEDGEEPDSWDSDAHRG